VPFVRDALSLVHDIGTLLNASALRRLRFSEVRREMIENGRTLLKMTQSRSKFVLKTMMKSVVKELKTKRCLLAG